MGANGQGETVDFGYLENFAAGDLTVIDEVLALFTQEAERWAGVLSPDDAGWREVIHTIKGASRGVGAFSLGDVCQTAESRGEAELPAVRAALAAAVADIQAYRARKRSQAPSS